MEYILNLTNDIFQTGLAAELLKFLSRADDAMTTFLQQFFPVGAFDMVGTLDSSSWAAILLGLVVVGLMITSYKLLRL